MPLDAAIVAYPITPADEPGIGLVALATAVGGSRVELRDLETGDPRAAFDAFEPGFTGGATVAVGNVGGQGPRSAVVAARAGGGPRVRVFDAAGRPTRDFFAFEPSFTGGVAVATGDVNGDGVADIITGAGAGGGPHVRAFDGRSGEPLLSFFAFEPTFLGGVNVAAVDLTGDGIDEVLVAAGSGGGPRVLAFDPTTNTRVRDFFAYDPSFSGGVFVAGADPVGNGSGTIVTGAGTGGGPHVRAFAPDGTVTTDTLAFDPSYRGGVSVAAFRVGTSWQVLATKAGETLVAGDRALLGPVLHADSPGAESFVDPSAIASRSDRVTIGEKSYVGPFARLLATDGSIVIGNESNVQDNVTLEPSGGNVEIGDQVILAHNAVVKGNSRVGKGNGGRPAFLGFNAVVDNAIVEDDAFVSPLAYISPGVTIPSGIVVLAGKRIQSQAEATDPSLGKVQAITDGERGFMAAVLQVHESFAKEYPNLVREGGIAAVSGISQNPGNSEFNPGRHTPELAGDTPSDAAAARFRNRVIGDVTLGDSLASLTSLTGNQDSIRADEGEPFAIGRIAGLANQTTFHALVSTEISVGSNGTFGEHVVIHGGDDSGNSPTNRTVIGDNVTIDDWAVVFRSTVGAGSRIGEKAYIDGSQLAPGTVVPDRAMIVNNEMIGFVEW